MATHRHRYLKIILFEPLNTNVIGATVVGQYGEWLLVERAAPKAKAATKKAATPRPKKANAHPTSVPLAQPGAEA